MENIYLQIDTTSEQAKRLLEYLKYLEFIRVIEEEEKIPLIEQIEIGLREVKKIMDGEVLEKKDFGEFLAELKENQISGNNSY
jgi:hypothetical protein